MPHHALISTVNAHDGSLSTMKRVCESGRSLSDAGTLSLQQVEEAARVLTAYENQARHPAAMFQDRHWHIDACLIPFHPHQVESGLKIFDTQCNRSGGFFTGNATTNTQHSTYIRSWRNCEANNMAFPAGALRLSDLKVFTEATGFQPGLASFLDELKKPENLDRDLIGYKVFHTQAKPDENGRPVRKVHGWVITDTLGNLVRSIVPEAFHPPTARVMDRATSAFTHEVIGQKTPLLRIDGGKLTMAHPSVVAHMRTASQDMDQVASPTPSATSGRKPN